MGMNQKAVRAAVWGKLGYVNTDSALILQHFPVLDYILMLKINTHTKAANCGYTHTHTYRERERPMEAHPPWRVP